MPRSRFTEEQIVALSKGARPGREDVVDAARARAAAGFAFDDLDGGRGLFAADEGFGPASSVEGGIDELGARVGFGESHGGVRF